MTSTKSSSSQSSSSVSPSTVNSSRLANSSAFSASANPNEDWTKVTDLAERRRIQNRIAQRNYRKKLKRRLEDLERRANSVSTSPEPQPRELYRSIEVSQHNTPRMAASRPSSNSHGYPHADSALYHPHLVRDQDSRSPPAFEYRSDSHAPDGLTFPSNPHSPEFHSYPMPSPEMPVYLSGFANDGHHLYGGQEAMVKQEQFDEQSFSNGSYMPWSEMEFPSYYHQQHTPPTSDTDSLEHTQNMWSMYPPTPDLVEDSPPASMGYFS